MLTGFTQMTSLKQSRAIADIYPRRRASRLMLTISILIIGVYLYALRRHFSRRLWLLSSGICFSRLINTRHYFDYTSQAISRQDALASHIYK